MVEKDNKGNILTFGVTELERKSILVYCVERIKSPIAFMAGIAYANNGSGYRQNAHIRNK